MNHDLCHYEVLEVSPRASAPVIKAAYRCLAQIYHPDKNPNDPQAAERLVRLNAAYAVLADPVRKARYDATLIIPRRPPTHERRGQSNKDPVTDFLNRRVSPGVRPFAFRPLS